MKIGIISDTHDQVSNIKKAVDLFNQEWVELVIHCGDWVAPFTLSLYELLQVPVKGVFGNNDGDRFLHRLFRDRHELDIEFEERFLELTVDQRKVCAFHGDGAGIVDALIKCGEYDAVFHGHTHLRVNETIEKTLSLNPGSLLDETTIEITGASIAIYDTKTNTAKHIMV